MNDVELFQLLIILSPLLLFQFSFQAISLYHLWKKTMIPNKTLYAGIIIVLGIFGSLFYWITAASKAPVQKETITHGEF